MKKYIPIVLKVLLALPMVVFGANKILNFLPVPPMSDPGAIAFFGAMAGSYLGKAVAITEIVGGVLVLVKERLGILVLLPITVNIVAFHLAHDIAGIGFGLVLLIINIYLILKNKEALQPILD